MSFKIRHLGLIRTAPFGTNLHVGFYTYATVDLAATVLADGYFNDAREKLNVNDVIDCVCAADGTGERVKVLVTAAPATGNVTVDVNTDASGA